MSIAEELGLKTDRRHTVWWDQIDRRRVTGRWVVRRERRKRPLPAGVMYATARPAAARLTWGPAVMACEWPSRIAAKRTLRELGYLPGPGERVIIERR